jgi:hypothetical protein
MTSVLPEAPSHPLKLSRRLRVALIVWLAMLGLDFVLGGGLFAGLYRDGGTFILAPADAFRRIPIGYLAFLIVAMTIVEITHRLSLSRMRDGIRFGVLAGAVFGGTWSLSLYSIATLSAGIALAFAVTWIVLITIGAAVAAAAVARTSLRGLVFRVIALDVVCVAVVITLQSAGVVPTVTS